MAKKRPSKKIQKRNKRAKAYQQLFAMVIGVLEPDAIIQEGIWVEGPDGRRDMDVLIEGTLDGVKSRILVECKDFDSATTGKVGIDLIDAIESKRHDLNVTSAMICSNSGFTDPAMQKAKRTGIGLVTILKAGDPAVKVEVREILYFRRVDLVQISLDFGLIVDGNVPYDEMLFEGLQIKYWIAHKIASIISTELTTSGTISRDFSFKKPVQFQLGNQTVTTSLIKLSFNQKTTWLSQIVRIDASLGLYDYLSGRTRFAPGEKQYIIRDVDFSGGTPINFVPASRDLQSALNPGEIDISMVSLGGLELTDDKSRVPNLDVHLI